jgi:dethiobiotin synthetase
VRSFQRPRIVFITGTDTGVGKTVLTALLLSHLRQAGARALAIKPFCSGGRGDAELLHTLQNGDLTLDQINPYYFPEPLAPLVAAREHNQQIQIVDVIRHVRSVLSHIPAIENRKLKIENLVLLIEGAGGLLAPLGESKSHSQFKVQSSGFKVQRSKCFTALDLINATNCSVIVVAPNRLGTINHTLLTVGALKALKPREIKVVLMDINDLSSSRNTQYATRAATRSNPSILTELLSPTPLFRIRNLGKNPGKAEQIHQFAKKFKKTLAQILA